MDYTYLFNLICQRRLVTLSKVESVAFNPVINFGLANNSYILPVVANTFYYVENFTVVDNATGSCTLVVLPNSGQGSVGSPYILLGVTQDRWPQFECDSMQYTVATHSAGTFNLFGTVFKITYIA